METFGKKHGNEWRYDNDVKIDIPNAIKLVEKLKHKKENETLTHVEKNVLIYLTALIDNTSNPI